MDGTTSTDPAGAGGGEAKSWLEQLPEGMRADKNLAKYESLEAFASGHLNALKRFGKDPNSLVEVPSKPDDEKAWGDLWGKLGRPEAPEGYQLQLAEGASEDDKAFVEGFRAVAFKAGMTQTQMAAAIGYLNEVTGKAGEAAAAHAEAAAAETTKTLKAEWGDKYDVYSKEIPKLIEDLGGKEAVEALNQEGMGNSPTLLKIFAKFADLRAEHGKLPGGGGGETETVNTPYQAQMKLAQLHGDQAKAKALQDKNDPLHKAVMKEREDLLKQAYPAGQ
ncbi:hypothetical protein CSW60_18550 [Caulobacter sp. X]|nr:hypothetical protein CSW60_18550 [Caulobacter sp. X]